MSEKIINCPCGIKQTNPFKHMESKKHYKYMVDQGREEEHKAEIVRLKKEKMLEFMQALNAQGLHWK